MADNPQLHFVSCQSALGIHRTAVWEWPTLANSTTVPTVFCAHGLTRNGRDFDLVAQRLRSRFRVLAVDFVGRGQSDRVSDPALYAVPQYVADSLCVLAHFSLTEIAWLGTSMGGIVGMAMASSATTPIKTLVLNDIGPQIASAGLARIATNVGRAPQLTDYEQAKKIVIANSATFGQHSAEHWDLFVKHYVVKQGDRWIFNYDPTIVRGTYESQREPINLWPLYDQIRARTLVLRGAESDLFEAEVAAQMTQRGPRAQLVEIARVGHAPTLLPADQIDIIENFLIKEYLHDNHS
jgi:pimeloyl-ACP methyl ester carboxylesterase